MSVSCELPEVELIHTDCHIPVELWWHPNRYADNIVTKQMAQDIREFCKSYDVTKLLHCRFYVNGYKKYLSLGVSFKYHGSDNTRLVSGGSEIKRYKVDVSNS